DLDFRIAELICERASARPQTSEDWTLLATQAESLKRSLSEHEVVQTSVQWDSKIQWEGELSREEVDDACRETIEKTIACCKAALQAANLASNEVDHVLMVGGSTRFPLVQDMV